MDHDPHDLVPRNQRSRIEGAAFPIQLAVDSVDFRPHTLDDPVPLGRQVLGAGGLQPPEAFSLHAILPSGDFEEVLPDEEIHLRAKGVERFVAFSTDRLFRATLNGRSIVWGDVTVSERALRVLSGISDDEAVYLEVRGGTDRLVPDGGGADLGGRGTEAFVTAPKQRLFAFFVNGARYESSERRLTGLQIKARVANWDPSHDLVLEGHGNDPDRVIADEEDVDLAFEHGPRRFSSVPKANFG